MKSLLSFFLVCFFLSGCLSYDGRDLSFADVKSKSSSVTSGDLTARMYFLSDDEIAETFSGRVDPDEYAVAALSVTNAGREAYSFPDSFLTRAQARFRDVYDDAEYGFVHGGPFPWAIVKRAHENRKIKKHLKREIFSAKRVDAGASCDGLVFFNRDALDGEYLVLEAVGEKSGTGVRLSIAVR